MQSTTASPEQQQLMLPGFFSIFIHNNYSAIEESIPLLVTARCSCLAKQDISAPGFHTADPAQIPPL